MSSVVIDACCLIDLLATGQVESILRAAGFNWHLPSAVEAEVQHVRQHDLKKPGQILKAAVELAPLLTSGILQTCTPVDPTEHDRFVHFATRFRSDGEAMCIAIAEHRGWTVATDDRKAILVAQQSGLTVISCPEILKRWAEAIRPSQSMLHKVINDIQILSQFRPNPSMPEYDWWINQITNTQK